jgi:hypothetical protein
LHLLNILERYADAEAAKAAASDPTSGSKRGALPAIIGGVGACILAIIVALLAVVWLRRRRRRRLAEQPLPKDSATAATDSSMHEPHMHEQPGDVRVGVNSQGRTGNEGHVDAGKQEAEQQTPAAENACTAIEKSTGSLDALSEIPSFQSRAPGSTGSRPSMVRCSYCTKAPNLMRWKIALVYIRSGSCCLKASILKHVLYSSNAFSSIFAEAIRWEAFIYLSKV